MLDQKGLVVSIVQEGPRSVLLCLAYFKRCRVGVVRVERFCEVLCDRVDASTRESPLRAAVSEEKNLAATLDWCACASLSLLDNLQELLAELDSAPIQVFVWLQTEDWFTLKTGLLALCKNLLKDRRRVVVSGRFNFFNQLCLHRFIDLQLSEVPKIVVIEEREVNSLKSELSDNFLCTFLSELSDRHRDVAVA